MESDRVLVLDRGRFVEFDSPHALLQRRDSLFSALVDETGSTNAMQLRSQAAAAAAAAAATSESVSSIDSSSKASY